VIAVRRARPADAPLIGAVHVAAWRSTYPGILPEDYLASLSVARQAAFYDRQIRSGAGVYVAVASGPDMPGGFGPRVVGYTTVGRARTRLPGLYAADGEIETLYVLDDWRDCGVGRQLIHAGAAHLATAGSRAAFLWVLSHNPSRWFYQHLGGKPVMESQTYVAGVMVPQTAFVWDPIEKLTAASPAP
jgi:ribosomal protein S18 acetylase RimI-like enzyme